MGLDSNLPPPGIINNPARTRYDPKKMNKKAEKHFRVLSETPSSSGLGVAGVQNPPVAST
jgi:hypothetical protein